jgi:hypothetical protein
MTATEPSQPTRDVVLGTHSVVWRSLQRDARIASRFGIAIGHRDVATFTFTPADRVWVFSYAPTAAGNEAMMTALERARVRELIYVSSAAAAVAAHTDCYAYPRLKRSAERSALQRPNARVLTLGLVYSTPSELPSGPHIATAFDDLADFMLAPCWPHGNGRRMLLIERVETPFRDRFELVCWKAYGGLMTLCGMQRPCLLRPLDLVLRFMGMRWYGYVFLSNKLWTSTTSSSALD